MGHIEERIAELGLSVPEVTPPVAAYVPAVRDGRYVYVSGQLPLAGGAMAATLAVAVVLRPGGDPPTPTPTTVAAAPDATGLPLVEADPADVLQEDPGFYVWLGSLDAHAIAME